MRTTDWGWKFFPNDATVRGLFRYVEVTLIIRPLRALTRDLYDQGASRVVAWRQSALHRPRFRSRVRAIALDQPVATRRQVEHPSALLL